MLASSPSVTAPSATVVYLSGVLNAESAAEFERKLISAMRCDRSNEVVVDMSQVESLDNGGLLPFMSALNAVRSESKDLSICSAPPAIRIVFELTQLDRIFTMVEHSPAAVAA
ncbi:MAG: anti-sigma B factor antagonist [Phormidesmis priestleyi Ana]|uniref:Anti-sigma B factor antagonist n=1 Tax=Phormidesmis priestleyi Ana TaxID=1666911 RepID=A0A0P7ZUT4_9CYAN|nr:MAG: anti-sigma B factor antagonist [Phormidesmis priestleyi Ana]